MQGMVRQRNAINQGALDGHVARMGGGDFEKGTLVKAAIDTWQHGVQARGAGPMDKLENVRRNKGAESGLTPARWQQVVQEGWPGTDVIFSAALKAGATLVQLATRWTKSKKTWRATSAPTREVQAQLDLRQSRKRSHP